MNLFINYLPRSSDILASRVTQPRLIFQGKLIPDFLWQCAYCKIIEGISIIKFDERDIVRHKLVKSIVRAYEKEEKETDKTKKSIKDQLTK